MAQEIICIVVHHAPCDCDIAPKLGQCFRREIELAAMHGTLCIQLFTLILSLLSSVRLDTQEVEGINSILKRAVDLAPAISADLLAARMVCKKKLAVSYNTAPLRDGLVQTCIQAHAAITEAYEKRFGRNAVAAAVAAPAGDLFLAIVRAVWDDYVFNERCVLNPLSDLGSPRYRYRVLCTCSHGTDGCVRAIDR